MVVTTNDVKMYRLLNGEFKFIQNIKLNEKGKLNAPWFYSKLLGTFS